MKKLIPLVCILAFLTFAAGCNASEKESSEGTHAEHGDLRQTTEGADVLPDFLAEKPENMQTLYQAVAKSKDLLTYIPCYCGCGDTPFEHKSNYECFIHDNETDGAIVWDDHATRCQACLDIAAESIIDYSNGKSIQEIRDQIDEAYKDGYPEPTKTPAPPKA